jgi:alginate O-acetyltransferase complex protein AlgI
MNPVVPWLWAAGGLHLLVASANFFAPARLHYRENLAKVTPIVREIFHVQSAYIVLTLAGFAALCFLFAPDLAGGSRLGRGLSGFLALFWGLRVLVQVFYYDAAVKRQNPAFHRLFLATFLYLTAVFTAAAAGLAG